MNLEKVAKLKEKIQELKEELNYIKNNVKYISPSKINIINIQASKKNKDFFDIKLKDIEYKRKELYYYTNELIKELIN